jgi:hypothetical protein
MLNKASLACLWHTGSHSPNNCQGSGALTDLFPILYVIAAKRKISASRACSDQRWKLDFRRELSRTEQIFYVKFLTTILMAGGYPKPGCHILGA